MSELRVIISNDANVDSAENSQNQTTTSGQAQINKAKEENKASDLKKSIVATSYAVVKSGVDLFSQYTNMQNSLEGNSAYSQRVATELGYLQKGVSLGGSFVTGALLTGNVAIGGALAVINGATMLASEIMQMDNIEKQNALVRTSQNLNLVRLGSANNIWRK